MKINEVGNEREDMIFLPADNLLIRPTGHKGLLPRRTKLYDEREFYAQKGKPTECFSSCRYQLNVGHYDYKSEGDDMPPTDGDSKKEHLDYETLMLITNSRMPYLRLVTNFKGREEPVDDGMVVSPKSQYSQGDDAYRESVCPKIAWGISAVFLWNLDYKEYTNDFRLPCDEHELMSRYYNMFRKRFMAEHTTGVYAIMSEEEKEMEFRRQHYRDETEAWKKSAGLEKYPVFYEYVEWFAMYYLAWLSQWQE